MTDIVAASDQSVARAAGLIRTGKLVAFPTETVYGLGADAGNDRAVAEIYAIKGRPAHNPLIVHCADIEQVFSIAEPTRTARSLAGAFWPGPLTMILNARADTPVCSRTCAGGATIAVRIPSHPVARSLITGAGLAIAAPSANPSGRVSPTRAAHVASDFASDGISLILDGGACTNGIESSIVDARSHRVSLLRSGGISRQQIEAITGPMEPRSDGVTVPGSMARHYAPSVPIRLNVMARSRGDESYLGFGLSWRSNRPDIIDLSPEGDVEQAASNLFVMLRRLEKLGRPIAVAPIPLTGVGEAVNDRLERAACVKK